jgi:hypothetical protein
VKLLLILVSVSLGSVAVIKTVEMMNAAANLMATYAP